MGRTCLKCEYTRLPTDGGPVDTCPRCGAVYTKLEALAAAGQAIRTVAVPTGEQVERARAEQTAALAALPGNEAPVARGQHTKYFLFALFGLAVLAVVALTGPAYQRRQAALAFCGAEAVGQWAGKFNAARDDFKRITNAAGVAPRVALAPLILRMSEAEAAFAKVGPAPPCMEPVAQAFGQAMSHTVNAFVKFAGNEGDPAVAQEFDEAAAAIARSTELMADAKRTIVK